MRTILPEHKRFKELGAKYGVTWMGRDYGDAGNWDLSRAVTEALAAAQKHGMSEEDSFLAITIKGDRSVEQAICSIKWGREHKAAIDAFQVECSRRNNRSNQTAALKEAGYHREVTGHRYIDGYTANISQPYLAKYEGDTMPIYKTRCPDGRLITHEEALAEIAWWDNMPQEPENPYRS